VTEEKEEEEEERERERQREREENSLKDCKIRGIKIKMVSKYSQAI